MRFVLAGGRNGWNRQERRFAESVNGPSSSARWIFRSTNSVVSISLTKQQAELRAFDEKLRHFADQRVGLDLDDGVKVNYGKFGDLLAEVKAVTGGSEE